LIWGGAAWWLFTQDQQIWGAFMIVWGCSSVWLQKSEQTGTGFRLKAAGDFGRSGT